MTTPTIRRCSGNHEAWCVDTGTSIVGPSSSSLDVLVQVLAGYALRDGLREITLVLDPAAEREAALCKLRREGEALDKEAARIRSQRRSLTAAIGELHDTEIPAPALHESEEVVG